LTTLLMIDGLLLMFAVKRGWKVAPFVLLALPPLLAELGPSLPAMALAGWMLPFTSLLAVAALLCTFSLLYTAIADPEPR
jgi:hypothetical protein